MISLFVPGLPIAQGRPRFKAIRMGQFTNVRVYDPTRSEEWKKHIKAQVVIKTNTVVFPKDGPMNPNFGTPCVNGHPVSLDLRFVLPRPRNIPKRVTQHVKKPDLDNLVKAVKDALTGLLYSRDSQVVKLTATKGYGRTPGVRIRVKEVAS